MTEAKLQAKMIKKFRTYGALAVKVSAEGRRGWPDLDVMHPTGGFKVEVKTPTGVTSELQKEMHKEIRKYGGIVYIIDNLAAIDAIAAERFNA